MIKGKVTYRKPAAFSRKLIRQAVKTTLGEVGLDWHRNTLPKHFAETAAVSYRYQKRKPKYEAEKLRRFGHNRPLVFTGALSAQVMRLARITYTGKGVRVTMKGPKYLYQRRKDYKQPDKAKEITATTTGELRTLDASVHGKLRRRLNETASTETTKI